MRTLLVDGDLLIYQAGLAVERDIQWETWLWTRHADLDEAITHLDDKLHDLRTQSEADRIVVALTDETNWRKAVMPSYKAKRTADKKPVVHKALREYVHEAHETFQRPTLEGDDVLGILATSNLIEGEKIVWSIDKDLLQIPGTHLRDGAFLHIEASEGEYLHMVQTLTGDATDGYPGCPGVGPVKAEKLLRDPHTVYTPAEMWEIVVAAYAKAGLSEEVALQNARVARICRREDYDFKRKEVKLWTPV